MAIPFKKLAKLANRKQPGAVKRWCQDRGILYILDADGRPTTSDRAYDEAILKGRKTLPNWEAQR